MEDLTDPEKIRQDPKCDRTVSLYGYLRGTYLKNKGQVHIPGKQSAMVLPRPSTLDTLTAEPLRVALLRRRRRLPGGGRELPARPLRPARRPEEEGPQRERALALRTHVRGGRPRVRQGRRLHRRSRQPRQTAAGASAFAAEKLNLGASVAGFGPIFFFPA